MTRAARRVYGSGSASRGRRGAGAPGVLRLLRGYAFAIAGIAIGVAGVVALGAMSERIVRFIEGGDRFVLGQISVAGRGMGMGAGFTAGGAARGSRLPLEGAEYGVVGILERMLTAPDRFVFVPIEDAREQWVAKDRMLRTLLASGAAALTAADLNTGVAVGWREGEDPDAVARRIMAEVPDVNVH